jgi:hypothetical protein
MADNELYTMNVTFDLQNASQPIGKDMKNPYAMQGLVDFQHWYAGYHGYVSVIVCVIGGVCNFFNIIVLTRRNMRSTTNYLLTALAVSDLLTMLSYIPFALQFYCVYGLEPSVERNTKDWAIFFLFHVNFSVTTHTISIWLGVILSMFRYAYVRQSSGGGISSCGTNKARMATLAVTVGSIIVLVPNYLSLQIVSQTDDGTNQTMYDLASVEDHLITTTNFWIHALVIKLIPCGLMLLFGLLLVCTMRSSNQRRRKMRSGSTTAASLAQRQHRRRDHSRTTGMLIAVIVLFLLTELPQGILALCSGLLPGFFEAYYIPLGDTMDIFALINNGINFILYCSMSRQFRETFLCLLAPCLLSPEKRRLNGVNLVTMIIILYKYKYNEPTSIITTLVNKDVHVRTHAHTPSQDIHKEMG